MLYKEGCVYHIRDEYFETVNDSMHMQNKENGTYQVYYRGCTVGVVTGKTERIRRLAFSCFPLSGDIETIPEITREEADENVRRAGYGVEVELLEKHTIDRYTNDNHATEI